MLKCAIKCETCLLTNKQQDKSPPGNELDCHVITVCEA